MHKPLIRLTGVRFRSGRLSRPSASAQRDLLLAVPPTTGPSISRTQPADLLQVVACCGAAILGLAAAAGDERVTAAAREAERERSNLALVLPSGDEVEDFRQLPHMPELDDFQPDVRLPGPQPQ